VQLRSVSCSIREIFDLISVSYSRNHDLFNNGQVAATSAALARSSTMETNSTRAPSSKNRVEGINYEKAWVEDQTRQSRSYHSVVCTYTCRWCPGKSFPVHRVQRHINQSVGAHVYMSSCNWLTFASLRHLSTSLQPPAEHFCQLEMTAAPAANVRDLWPPYNWQPFYVPQSSAGLWVTKRIRPTSNMYSLFTVPLCKWHRINTSL